MDIFSTKKFVRGIADEMEIQGDPRYFTEAEVVKVVNLAFKEHKAINNYEKMQAALERIKSESSSLDGGVFSGSAGDKQISRLWTIAADTLSELNK